MPNFSAFIPEIHHGVSPGFVDVFIKTRRSELFTGLMQLCRPSDENLVFAFVEGVERELYRSNPGTTENIPRSDWSKTLFSSDSSVGLLPLSLEAMRVVQVAHAAPVVRVEQMDLDAVELLDQANGWALDSEPSVIHVHTSQSDFFYLCAKRSNLIMEEIAFVNGKVQYSITDSSFAQSLPQVAHQVTRYISESDHTAWRNYELRIAFAPLMRMLMQRFSELAGRGLTERLGEQLSAWARGGGWNMTFSSNGVSNHEYFDSVEEALNAYRDLLARFQHETGQAIGARMVENISREVLLKLNVSTRELLMRYIFTQYGSGSLVAGP